MAAPLILVIEDDEHEQEIYGRVLWYNGFDVVFANDGAQGLALARARRPDLILLDLMLPGLSGVELSARLRADVALTSVPIVVLSALPGENTARERVRYRWLSYLEKPTSPIAVLHEVESVVGRAPPPVPAEADEAFALSVVVDELPAAAPSVAVVESPAPPMSPTAVAAPPTPAAGAIPEVQPRAAPDVQPQAGVSGDA